MVTEGRTDRQMDRQLTVEQTDGRALNANFLNGGYTIIPRTLLVAGYNKLKKNNALTIGIKHVFYILRPA